MLYEVITAFTTSDVSGRVIENNGEFYANSTGALLFSIPATDNGTPVTPPSKIFVMDGKSIGDYIFNNANSGFGIDLGVTWKINPQLTFTASALDLGKIKWTKYLYKLDFNDGLYAIENIHINPRNNFV